MFGQIPYASANIHRLCTNVEPIDFNRSFRWLNIARSDFHGSGFPSPIWPQKPDDFARFYGKGNLIDSPLLIVLFCKILNPNRHS